ncbi:MAG: hypothetical protein UY41_C0004G0003 [Candidatus Moranbacteria bacterium GW2011_GWE1_49_15]|nr:MAG: hypothetical protein UX75_C0005G0005 [Candidatus Moranbacteria bacterium GW2011_GWE2_47_10]KKW07386.1 MAG: hypothetical protein UY41_C0004G0003 [Candidatus Moranbacteria bacterium GW2011_GWE1_49_15]HBP00912.1 hypothetical protein [Candidatus Moranbacteria bacterium]
MKLAESFISGAIAALVSLFLIEAVAIAMQLLFSENGAAAPELLFYAPSLVVLAVLIEEAAKFFIINKKISLLADRKSIVKGALALGLGFSSIEALFIFLGSPSLEKLPLAISSVAIVHVSTAVMIAYAIEWLRMRRLRVFAVAILPAAVAHLAFNLSLMREREIFTVSVLTVLVLALLTASMSMLKAKRELA